MLTINEELFADIPSLHVYKTENQDKPLPTVIFWHGFGSGKEHNLHVAYRLAMQDIRVILPEAVHHGTRGTGLTEKQAQMEFWSIVVKSVSETKNIKSALEEQQLIQDARLFVGGTSMGGILTCGALAAYPWIKGAVVLMGCPSWEKLAREQIAVLKEQGALPISQEDIEAQIQKLVPYDLSQHDAALDGRPLFFWHGRDDAVVPYQYSYDFYEKMKHTYSDRRRFIYHLNHSAGHKVSRTGMIEMCDWVADYI
ncbi:hypothetical protein SAMN05192534_11847 [Alteribacillus persepolensis]|uniref:Peptidase S9 prolyl oligopeptidase catalytic domain-containing protein n=1 Tax=Alteribacillus persepolensis TaxID=568899 RepID=A0A1G8H486_9BACI|nr:alpha/beta hydrolase [Alteribacillus persepolensis]SDI01416.1 hypothetical protein SAMN05192534_11847 [Alteribacillus persepolensis]